MKTIREVCVSPVERKAGTLALFEIVTGAMVGLGLILRWSVLWAVFRLGVAHTRESTPA